MLLLAALAAAAAPDARARPQPPEPAGRFTYHGLGAVTAGQDLAQAEAALGQALAPETSVPRSAASAALPPAATGCHYRASAGQPGVRYTVAGAVITRVETRDARYATVSGVRVGDSLQRVRQVYGQRLSTAAHPYFDRGWMLSVHSPDHRHALVMESNDAGRIIMLRGGRLPDVGWLEGCS